MTRLFIVAGHGGGDSGSAAHGYTEAERVRALASKLKDIGGDSVEVGDTSFDWYSRNQFANMSNPGCPIVELHMDSFPGGRGGHVIVAPGKRDEFTRRLAAFISGNFPGKAYSIDDRDDLQNLNICRVRGYDYRLLECCFISNYDDLQKFNSNLEGIARGILEAAGVNVMPKDARDLQQYTPNLTTAQRFKKVRAGLHPGYYYYKNVATGKYLDADGAAKKAGTKVNLYTLNKTAAQAWKWSGKQLVCKCAPKLVMDIAGGSYDDGADVQLYTPNGTTAQNFVEIPTGTPNEFYILNMKSMKVLDATGGGR
jgi:hypothetical protein